ncbi:nucleoside triphosphate pyrophosphohydrolase [Fusobacterium perfoetens]|uniref:nucleoside triphosphate pyrophosphohydrolase n=1 Tax=Fusobacterium perfoetens TaxID=852 RepID=UPI0023F22383|nr:nucleoside triphosphate pyrophosphohydrolase [Fusobacterium perfoetens]MDY3237893.1 nucleoside triphosphate pyrophosphohydrolase [Fusobacterium perfoetens]
MKEFYKLVETLNILRGDNGCPWDREQTRESLKAPFLEEVYEALDVMDKGGEELCGELGDVLLHIIFQGKIAEEKGEFTIEDICQKINEKLIRRHPHIFGSVEVGSVSDVERNWEEIKKTEKEHQNRKSVLDGIPKGLPALLKAQKIQKKVKKYGFDWDNIEDVYAKVQEEIKEVEEAVKENNHEHIEEEIGDLLFAITNYARHLGVDSSEALRKTNEKFEKRFRYIEENCDIENSTLEEMDKLWNEAKKDKKL